MGGSKFRTLVQVLHLGTRKFPARRLASGAAILESGADFLVDQFVL